MRLPTHREKSAEKTPGGETTRNFRGGRTKRNDLCREGSGNLLNAKEEKLDKKGGWEKNGKKKINALN